MLVQAVLCGTCSETTLLVFPRGGSILFYVSSGSEDAKGYLWDKHYRSQLANFEHESGVVNAVGFNPVDQEYLVTVCDDSTIKVWRSRQRVKQMAQCSDD